MGYRERFTLIWITPLELGRFKVLRAVTAKRLLQYMKYVKKKKKSKGISVTGL
jgi:hypothetical protein